MRILVLTDHYPPYYEGGYELHCHQVTEELRARNHDVSVLTTTFGVSNQKTEGHVYRYLHFLKTPYKGQLDRRTRQLKRFLRGRQNYQITHRLVKEIALDVAYIWNVEAASILPILAIQDLGIPVVFRVESHWLFHLWKEYIADSSRLRRWYRSGLLGFRRFDELKFELIMLPSKTLQQDHEKAGFNAANMHIIPNGIPGAWIEEQPPGHKPHKNGTIRLLYAGRLEAVKGPDIAIKAIAHLVKNSDGCNVKLDMIGNGQPEYINLLKQLVKSNGLEQIVTFSDAVPRDELVRRYAEYDGLLFPTPRWEGQPFTIIEAMAKGLPVIASNIGGPRDIIDNGQTGFLVTPEHPIEMAMAIEKLIKTPQLKDKISSAAVQAIRQNHIFERLVDRHEELLKKAAA